MFGAISGALSVASGIKGLFGSKKPQQPDIADNIRDQAWGARQAAEKFGFNPLTMLQYGQPGGAGFNAGGGTPPLASVEAITTGLTGIDDIVSGDAARRRAADQAELDLAKVRLDQARSGVMVGMPTPPVASGPGAASSVYTGRPMRVAQSNSVSAPAKFGPKPQWATGRELDVAPVTNSPGVFELQNPWTNDKPITIPGEGEPWGIDELGTAVTVGAPQVLRNIIRDERETRQSEEPEETRARHKAQAARVIRGETFIPQPGFLGVFQAARKLWD